MSRIAVILLFHLLIICILSKSDFQCIDNDGNTVDWWWVYKLNKGTKYAYIDDSSTDTKLTPLTTQSLDAGNNSCVERTFNQIFDNKANINYIGYNDENPNGTTSYTSGHSKGVLAFDDTAKSHYGFWIIQAVPKFPNLNAQSYEFASNGVTYGQNFLCISLNSLDEINSVSNQLRYVLPFIFSYNNINSYDDSIGNFTALSLSSWLDGVSITNIISTNGKEFTHLARSGSENKDIMEDIISPHYSTDFEWQTWPNESSFEPPYCKPKYQFNEENIQKIVLGNNWYVYNDDDHSKYGIDTNGMDIVCSGDLNRATSQNSRGGGYACFKQSNLYNAINNVITQVDKC